MTSHADMSDEEIVAEMLRTHILYNEEWPLPVLNLNDTFAYACGEGEPVPPEALPEVIHIYRRFGPVGCICWAAKQRGEEPVVEYTEDPVYQATWAALYGGLHLAPNRCNKSDPRWSNDPLDLKPWD
jgi:hypothetical protein